MRLAIMQPYFAAYPGWFRLLSETDLFCCLDTVQFQRRGFMHRNRLLDRNGVMQWLTLPLAEAPLDVKIQDLTFAPDAYPRMVEQMRRFPAFESLPFDIVAATLAIDGGFVPYTMNLLQACCKRLSIRFNVTYASALDLPDMPAQDRIIEICKRLGASEYVNAPGGRSLYQPEAFKAAGIDLQFLPPWTGPTESILQVMAEKRRLVA
jgi:hypothetical protein